MPETDSRISLPAMSEEEFLERQAADANAAIIETVHELFDVRGHIRQHPWWSVGFAGLAGVATGSLLQGHRCAANDGIKQVPPKNAVSPVLKTIIGEALKFLIPTLFTGVVLKKTEDQINQVTESAAQQ